MIILLAVKLKHKVEKNIVEKDKKQQRMNETIKFMKLSEMCKKIEVWLRKMLSFVFFI